MLILCLVFCFILLIFPLFSFLVTLHLTCPWAVLPQTILMMSYVAQLRYATFPQEPSEYKWVGSEGQVIKPHITLKFSGDLHSSCISETLLVKELAAPLGSWYKSFANVTDLKLHQELVKGSAHCTQAQNKPKYLLFRKTPLRNSGVRTTQRMSQSTLNNKEMFYSKVFVVNEHKRNPYPTLKRTVQRGKQTSYPTPECNEVEKEQG